MRLLSAVLAIAAASPATANAPLPRPAQAPGAATASAPVPAPPRVDALVPTAERCSYLVRRGAKLDKDDAPWLVLLNTTDRLARPTTTGQLQGVYCERDSLVPGENDDRVPMQLHVPLFINAPGGMTVVDIKDRRFQVRAAQGANLTSPVRSAISGVVQRWQAKPAPAPARR
jgi:hypothetical protein